MKIINFLLTSILTPEVLAARLPRDGLYSTISEAQPYVTTPAAQPRLNAAFNQEARKTNSVASADGRHSSVDPTRTLGENVHKIQSRQAESITPVAQAVIFIGTSRGTDLPPYICGFYSTDPKEMIACATTETCYIKSELGTSCAGGSTTYSSHSNFWSAEHTTCENKHVTDPADPNLGADIWISTSTLFCDPKKGYECRTDIYGSAFTALACVSPKGAGTFSVFPTSQFLSYYAGYTLDFTSTTTYGGYGLATWLDFNVLMRGTRTLSSVSIATDIVGYLSDFRSDAPRCVDDMDALCPTLYNAVQGCYNASVGGDCYCDALTNNTCPGLCLDGAEPNRYLRYVLPGCEDKASSSNTSNSTLLTDSDSPAPIGWKADWPDYPNLSHAAYLQLFPWKWRVDFNATEPDISERQASTETHCPSVTSTLVSFALVNLVVFASSIITANRYVIFKITFGLFGGPEGGKWWPASALLMVALNMLGNSINVLLVRSTPGYRHVPFGPLLLLWCTRPRLAWLVILLLWLTRLFHFDKSTYIEATVAALMAEAILQVCGSFYLGLTINHARANGFYLRGHMDYTPHAHDALAMYVGALIWAISIGLVVARAVWAFTPVGSIVTGVLVKIGGYIANSCKWAAKCIWWPFKHIRRGRSNGQPQVERRADSKGPQNVTGTDHKSARPPERVHRKQAGNKERKDTGQQVETRIVASEDGKSESETPQPEMEKKSVVQRVRSHFKKKFTRWVEGGPQNVILDTFIEEMGFGSRLQQDLSWVFWLMLLPWLGQWLFWVGFVRLAAESYCPPSVWTLAGVWSGTSAAGVFFGAALA